MNRKLMYKRTSRSGFTMVELVIVIAVIAILAAVLIPTFASVVTRANEAKDAYLIKGLNTALATAEKKPETMHAAMELARSFGYSVDDMRSSVRNTVVVWDRENCAFCLFNEKNGKVTYYPEQEAQAPLHKTNFWKIYDTIPALDDQDFSIYYVGGALGNVEVCVGLDVGAATVESITVRPREGAELVVRARCDNINVEGSGSTKIYSD